MSGAIRTRAWRVGAAQTTCRDRRLGAWSVLAVALLVGLAAAFGITALIGRAVAAHHAEVLFLRIDELSVDLHALNLQALVAQGVSPELAAHVADENAKMDAALTELENLAAGTPAFQPVHDVHAALNVFRTNVDEEMRLLAAGQVEQARRFDATTVFPSFTQLDAALGTAGDGYAASVVRAQRMASLGATLVLLAAALTIGGLSRQFERSRQATALTMMAALQASEERYRAIVETQSDLVCRYLPDGTLTFVNDAYCRFRGRRREELLGRAFLDHVPDQDRPSVQRHIAALVAGNSAERPEERTYESRVDHLDGRVTWYQWVDHVIRGGDGRVIEIQGIGRDITERREAEARLAYQAFHDSLTGLPNRALLLDRLAHALHSAERGNGSVAVFILDLDRFKVVNDSLGHAAGDGFLVEATARLGAVLRPDDTLARFGGDEFIALLPETDTDAATAVAQRLLTALVVPFAIDHREVVVNASVGITVVGSRPVDAGEVLREVDVALYAAKAAGRGQWAVFDAAMDAEAAGRLDRETDLRRAVARGEFVLHYQPKVELATGRVVGAEALVRWEHPERGLLPPGEFIWLAEETGLIVPLGRWALREACHQARSWPDHSPGAPLLICVNVAMRQLDEGSLITDVTEALAASGLDPCRLELELTESAAMRDAPEVGQILRDLHKLGVRLAIDDFGTGFASLSRLRQRGFDMLKIDRSFIAGLGRDRDSLAIVRAATTLAHDLGMDITAEGVETAAQAALLRELAADYAQGYFFARPVPAEQLPGHLVAAFSSEAAHAIDGPGRTVPAG